MSDERNRRKTRVGIVLSDKMDKTVVVGIEDFVRHSLYGKAAAWYRENDPETLKMMAGGLSFTNKMEKLGADTVKKQIGRAHV